MSKVRIIFPDGAIYVGEGTYKDGVLDREGLGKLDVLESSYFPFDTFYQLKPALFVGQFVDSITKGPLGNGVFYFVNKQGKPAGFSTGYWTGRDIAIPYQGQFNYGSLPRGYRKDMEFAYYSHEEYLKGIYTNESLVKKSKTIFVGDSYFEFWSNDEQAKDYSFYNCFHNGITNLGLGGTTASMWLHYFPELIKKGFKPNRIVMNLGFNDIHVSHGNRQWCLENMTALIKLIRASLPNTKIYFLSVISAPFFPQFLPIEKSYNAFIKENAISLGVTFIDTNALFIEGSKIGNPFGEDDIHPGAFGYKILAESLSFLNS
jgi:lysophospholipase L1-like esterase